MNRATEKLISLELEKSFLCGLFRNPQVIYEADSFLKEGDFHSKINQTIFIVCREILLRGDELSKTLVAQKVKELNISFKDPISPFDYIDSITMSPMTHKAALANAKELVKLRVRRDLFTDAKEVQSYLLGTECTKNNVSGIVAEVDSIYNKRINSINTDDEPIDLYAELEERIRERAANPVSEIGLKTPFPIFNQFFGGLRSKNGLYNIISRSGEGKSTFLFNMAKGVAKINDCPVLYLDTEMDLELNSWRAGAGEAIINPWFLETGSWVKNHELVKRVEESFKSYKNYSGKIYHKQCPNASINEILGIIRKWYFKTVGRGNRCLVVYDYMKITSDIDKNRQEWQQLGDKVSMLNEIGSDLDIHLWSAGQQNRGAQQYNQRSGQSQRNDDSTTAGASDRINMYSCFNATFREKTLDEVSEHGVQFGTHLMKPFKVSRTQGKDSYFKHKNVRVVDQSSNSVVFRQNFINYKIDEFAVSEAGTYADVIRSQELKARLAHDHGQDQEDVTL